MSNLARDSQVRAGAAVSHLLRDHNSLVPFTHQLSTAAFMAPPGHLSRDGDHIHSSRILPLSNSQVSSSSVGRFTAPPPCSLALCHGRENSSSSSILNTGKRGAVLMAIGIRCPSSQTWSPRDPGHRMGLSTQRWACEADEEDGPQADAVQSPGSHPWLQRGSGNISAPEGWSLMQRKQEVLGAPACLG